MASIAVIGAQLTPLQEIQKAFCLFKLSGEVWVGDIAGLNAWRLGAGPEVGLMYRRPAGAVLMQRHLETLPAQSDPKKTIQQFLSSPNTQVFDSFAFSPLQTPQGTCNLWVGPQVEPAPGDWEVIKTFLLEVICNGDIVLFRYLALFLADMLQRPGVKPGIMITLLGGQGTGKGTLFQILNAVWSRTTLLVSDVDHVIGHFNAAIERKFVLCMDEALFAGDKKATDRLKSLVTEPTVTIEEKHLPRRSIASFHRFFAASNHAHFAQVDTDDRRFVFFRVSEERKGDFEYWRALHRAIADPASIAAMVHELGSYTLTKFNVRERPRTAAHTDQTLRSLSGFDRYWLEVLQTACFRLGSGYAAPTPWGSETFESTAHLMTYWAAHEGTARRFNPKQERDLHSALNRLCPSATIKRQRGSGGQQRGYAFPALPVAREEFAKAVGGEVPWAD